MLKKQILFFVLIIFSLRSYSQFPPLVTGTINGISTLCAFNNVSYSIAPVEGATFYSWSFPFSWTGKSNTNTIEIIPTLNSGTISVSTTNSKGQIISARLSLNVIDCNTRINKYGLKGFQGILNVSKNFGTWFVDYKIDKSQLIVYVSDLIGKEIYKSTIFPDTNRRIDLAAKPGLYILEIYDANNFPLLQKKISVE